MKWDKGRGGGAQPSGEHRACRERTLPGAGDVLGAELGGNHALPFSSHSRTAIPPSFLPSLMQPEMKGDIHLFKTYPYVPMNINKYIEFTAHVGLLHWLILYNRTKS